MELYWVISVLMVLSTVGARKNSTINKFEGKKVSKRDVFYLGYGSNNKIYAIPTASENGSVASPFSFIQPYRNSQSNSGYKVNEETQKQVDNLIKSQNVPGVHNFYQQYTSDTDGDGENESPQSSGGQGLAAYANRGHLDQHRQQQQSKIQQMQPFDVIKLIQENALRQGGMYKNSNNENNYRHFNFLPNHQSAFGESQQSNHQSAFGESQQSNHQSAFGESQQSNNQSPFGESQSNRQSSFGENQSSRQNAFGESQPNAQFVQPPINNPYNRIYQQLEAAKYNMENNDDETNQYQSSNTDAPSSSPTNQPLHVVQPIVLNNLNDLPQLIAATLNRNINNHQYRQREHQEGSSNQQIKIIPTLSTSNSNDQVKIVPTSSSGGGSERFNLLPNLNSRTNNEHVKVLSSNSIMVPSSQLYRLSSNRYPSHRSHGGSKRSFDGYSEENLSGEMPAGEIRRSFDYDQLSESANTESSVASLQQTNPVAKQLNIPNYETVPEAQDRASESFPGLPNFMTTQLPTAPTQFMGLGVNPNHALQQSLERYAKIASVLNKQKQQDNGNSAISNYETLLQNLQNNDDSLTANQLTGTVPSAVIVNDKNHIAFLNSFANKRKSNEFLENGSTPTQKFTNVNNNIFKEFALNRQSNNGRSVYEFSSDNIPKVYENSEQNFKATEKPNIIIYPILNNGFTVRPDEYPKLVQKIIGDKFNDIKTLLNPYHGDQQNQHHQNQHLTNQNQHHQHHQLKQLSTEIPINKFEQVNELKNYQREGRSGDNNLVSPNLGDYHIIHSPNGYNPLNNKFSFISFTLGGDARHKRKINNNK